LYEFQIDELQFRLEPMKVQQALKGLKILSQIVAPIFTSGDGEGNPDWSKLDKALLSSLIEVNDCLPTFIDEFKHLCKVNWQGKWVPVANFLDLIFQGRTTLLLAWLIECLGSQYSDFLSASGRELLITKGAKVFSSLSS
jgi:hypothetical protein